MLLGVALDIPGIYHGAAGLLLAVAAFSVLMPARRAAVLGPSSALREE